MNPQQIPENINMVLERQKILSYIQQIVVLLMVSQKSNFVTVKKKMTEWWLQ